ncbi:2,3-diaminopropionate biosynthesis protein SbnA [Burkholderia glumae]|uniref:2,3-diaminopropionate biosynthesis protein SbnA n=1 Tax=Burkholderia glumae TaxID=337 RepID=UPI00039B7B2D|nr:2,3-diaminopropionate biosynthesis protein SbnA [Burkholderia glumae]MCM2494901.1 2,3-diaminopropionate biosynthesis protein SbnA [Burkholderia glumae]
MIYDHTCDIVLDNVFLRLPDLVPGSELLLKLEGLNPAGSIKLKAALGLIGSMEAANRIRPGSSIIESSSGNLGIALAVVSAARGYRLTIVTDPNASRESIRIIRSLGAQVVEVIQRDAQGGFLQTRIDYIHQRLVAQPELVWLNQYANPANVHAHRRHTATSILSELGNIDVLFVGAGTTGTLMGCVEHFTQHSPRTRIIAVDSAGSVTFGTLAAPRFVPGLGTSRRPEIYVDNGRFEKMLVHEAEAIVMCRKLAARYGLLAGGSTGTVLAAVERLAPTLPPGSRIVAISPDQGDKYLNTVYSDEWVAERFPSLARRTAQADTTAPVAEMAPLAS